MLSDVIHAGQAGGAAKKGQPWARPKWLLKSLVSQQEVGGGFFIAQTYWKVSLSLAVVTIHQHDPTREKHGTGDI